MKDIKDLLVNERHIDIPYYEFTELSSERYNIFSVVYE